MESSLCVSYCKELQEGVHDLRTDVVKVALYTTADLDYTTTAYTTTNEVIGAGYSAGGVTTTLLSAPAVMGRAAAPDYADAAWTSSSFPVRQALWYNSTKANRAIAVVTLPNTLTITNGPFTLQAPAFTESEAMLRIIAGNG